MSTPRNVEAFVPSPRFLSDSPARHPYISRPYPSSPSQQQLRSPVPPPPANLFAANPSAFNVDPGVPFLATAGPSDAGGSINDPESPKRFGEGFVNGLKKTLTIKGSRRRSPRYQQAGEDTYDPRPEMIRDSGYAASDQLEKLPANQLPFSGTSPLQNSLPTTSQPPPLNGYHDYQTNSPFHDTPSLDSMASAVTAHVGYGPDYAKMDRPTPPQSDVSFNTYMIRLQNFIHDLVALPWIAKERVTVDYYPSGHKRNDNRRLPRRPLITWRSKDYSHANYHLDSDTSESLTLKMTPHLHVRAPSHSSRADINLDSEFSNNTHSPFPYYPPNTVQTPDRRRVQSEGVNSSFLEEEVKPLSPHALLPPFPAHQQWADPPTQTLASNYPPAHLPNTLNYDQIPKTAYTEEPRPGSQSTPKHNWTQREPLPSLPPNTSGERSRNDTNPTFSTPLRHRPPSALHSSHTRRDTTPREGTPKYEYSAALKPSQRQPTSGSPSRRSHKSQRPLPSAREWESFPQDRPGYVPFEFSENYYGTIYGTGIHGLLPPVGRVGSTGSTTAPSIKQPQPQYPKSGLVTPSSRTASLRA